MIRNTIHRADWVSYSVIALLLGYRRRSSTSRP
jgi:hypothetical protein